MKSEFIKNILDLLLDEEYLYLKPQIQYLEEKDVEYTGMGVFIGFNHKKGIEKHQSKTKRLIVNGVILTSSELEDGAECILFFFDGLIDFLEIISFSGNYPKKELQDYELSQNWENSPKRIIKNEG